MIILNILKSLHIIDLQTVTVKDPTNGRIEWAKGCIKWNMWNASQSYLA